MLTFLKKGDADAFANRTNSDDQRDHSYDRGEYKACLHTGCEIHVQRFSVQRKNIQAIHKITCSFLESDACPVYIENDLQHKSRENQEKDDAHHTAAAAAPFGAEMILRPIVDVFQQK